jgi:hypothetical protein
MATSMVNGDDDDEPVQAIVIAATAKKFVTRVAKVIEHCKGLSKRTQHFLTTCKGRPLISRDECDHVFVGSGMPTISLLDYIIRTCSYIPEPAVCAELAVNYLVAYVNGGPTRIVDRSTVHRLAFVAFMVACKVSSDKYYTNKFMARLGGIGAADLRKMEIAFLFDLNFAVWPP